MVLVVTVNSSGRARGVPYKIYNDLLELLQNGQNVSAFRLLVLLLAGRMNCCNRDKNSARRVTRRNWETWWWVVHGEKEEEMDRQRDRQT